MTRVVDAIIDRGWLPDPVLRRVIRLLLRGRIRRISAGGVEERASRRAVLISQLANSPVTVATDAANTQHYEVPTGLFLRMLGPHLKYSCAWWPAGVASLAAAEEAMLRLTCERAELRDGQDILELGCGWGSLTLYMADRFPTSRIVAVSNSATQRDHIIDQARQRGLDNFTVLTADVADLDAGSREELPVEGFDRVVSVEMFEHVRNHVELTERIARWLRANGKLFVHVFAHRDEAYLFETGTSGDWMARHFFTGGIMPSDDLLPEIVDALRLEQHWVVSGTHYARTLRAWLDRLDRHRGAILRVLASVDPASQARARFNRWRVFTIACEELFAFRGGDEWHVSHYLFARRD